MITREEVMQELDGRTLLLVCMDYGLEPVVTHGLLTKADDMYDYVKETLSHSYDLKEIIVEQEDLIRLEDLLDDYLAKVEEAKDAMNEILQDYVNEEVEIQQPLTAGAFITHDLTIETDINMKDIEEDVEEEDLELGDVKLSDLSKDQLLAILKKLV